MTKKRKRVPIPAPAGGAQPKYGFGDLKVGDSIKVKAAEFSRAVNAAIKFGNYHGMRFTSRRAELRIWRVK